METVAMFLPRCSFPHAVFFQHFYSKFKQNLGERIKENPGPWDVGLKCRRPKGNSCLLGKILQDPTYLIRHAAVTFTGFY